MAIIGLTDQAAAFPILGVLRKGEEKKSDTKPGADLTYFRFVSEDSLANQMFSEAYPNQDALRNIHIFLPNKTAGENFDAWIEEWVAGGLVHRCDGKTQVLWRKPDGSYSTEPRPCQNCKGKQVGRLSVIVPELGRLATVTVLTTSKHDIMNLDSQLRRYEALRGDLRGIPFVLRRRKFKISTPGPDGKRVRREKWLLSIETQPEWTMLQLAAIERAALPATEGSVEGSYRQLPALIEAPDDAPEIDLETGEVIEPEEPAQPEPTPEPAKTNGNGKPQRPYDPETVKRAITDRATKHTGSPSPEQMDYLASSLSKACDGDDKKRHTVTTWLVGRESLKDEGWTKGEVSALIDWIGAKQENGYEPSEFTLKEIDLIVHQYQLEQGQQQLWDDDEVPVDHPDAYSEVDD